MANSTVASDGLTAEQAPAAPTPTYKPRYIDVSLSTRATLDWPALRTNQHITNMSEDEIATTLTRDNH